METNNRPQDEGQYNTSQQTSHEMIKNLSAEKDIAQSHEELEKEQQFKEAMTERD